VATGFRGSPLLPGMLAPVEVSNLRPGFFVFKTGAANGCARPGHTPLEAGPLLACVSLVRQSTRLFALQFFQLHLACRCVSVPAPGLGMCTVAPRKCVFSHVRPSVTKPALTSWRPDNLDPPCRRLLGPGRNSPRETGRGPYSAHNILRWRAVATNASFDILLRRNKQTCDGFKVNGKAKITRVLFQSRHAWFWLHQCRYWVDRCGGAVLGMSFRHGKASFS
jgi:hypothetical protein